MSKIRKLPLVLGALLLAPVVGLEIARAVSPAEDASAIPRVERRSAGAWATVHRCWLGAPLAAGETAEQRVHGIATEHDPKGGRDAWPGRCAQPMRAFAAMLMEGHPELPRRSTFERLAEDFARGDARVPATLGLFAGSWLDRASRVEPLAAIEPAPAPPEPAMAWGEGLFAPEGVARGESIGADGRLRFQLGARTCTAEPDGARIACALHPDALPAQGSPWTILATDGLALLVATRRATATTPFTVVVVAAESGEIVWQGPRWVEDARVREGSFHAVVLLPDGRALFSRDASGKLTTKPLAKDDAHAFFFDDHVISIGARVRVAPTASAPAGAIDLGPAPARVKDRVSAVCRTAKASFALIPGVVVRHEGASWKAIPSPASFVACEGGTVSWTALGEAGIERTDCDDAGCTSKKAALDKLDDKAKRAAVACGSNVLLVEGARGFVRAAVGPIESLDRAPRRALFPIREPRAKVDSLYNLSVVPVTGGGLVLARTELGYVAARLGCDGSVTRVKTPAPE